MVATIKCSKYDFVVIETNNVSFHSLEMDEIYIKFKDPKWIKHAKKHHFNPNKDCYNPKIWDQYLRLCAEGLI